MSTQAFQPTPFAMPAWADVEGWHNEDQYSTIMLADIDGDGQGELIGRSEVGIETWKFDSSCGGWYPFLTITDLSDANGWDKEVYYSTIFTCDLDGNGCHSIIARASGGILVYTYDTINECFGPRTELNGFTDEQGFNKSPYFNTIRCLKISSTTKAVIGLSGSTVFYFTYDTTSQSWNDTLQQITVDIIEPTAFLVADFNGDGTDEIAIGDGSFIAVYSLNIVTQQLDPLGENEGVISSLSGTPMIFTNISLTGDSTNILFASNVTTSNQFELAYRDSTDGLTFLVFDSTNGWEYAYSIPQLSDANGWNEGSLAQTISPVELIVGSNSDNIVARSSNGIVAWELQSNSSFAQIIMYDTDTVFTDANGWGEDEYGLTLRWGYVNNSDTAQLVARNQSGIITYTYTQSDPPLVSTYVAFPALVSQDVYVAISKHFIPVQPGVEQPYLRDCYCDMGRDWGSIASQLMSEELRHLVAPSGVTKEDFRSVALQLYEETRFLGNVIQNFQFAIDAIQSVYLSETITLIAVSESLEIKSDQSVSVDLLSLVSSTIGIAASVSGLGSGAWLGFSASAWALSSTISGITSYNSSQDNSSTIEGTIADVAEQLCDEFISYVSNAPTAYSTATNYLGSIQLLQLATDSGFAMPGTVTSQSGDASFIKKATSQYALFLYQQLMPIKYGLAYMGTLSSPTEKFGFGRDYNPPNCGAGIAAYIEYSYPSNPSSSYRVQIITSVDDIGVGWIKNHKYPHPQTINSILKNVQNCYGLTNINDAAQKYFFGDISGMEVLSAKTGRIATMYYGQGYTIDSAGLVN